MSRRTAFKVMAVGLLLIGLYVLAGFVVLPALVERQAPAYAAERLEAELTVGDTSFNPFLLRFVAQDLRLAQQDQQEPMLTLERLVIDLDWSSLWSQAWTLSTLRLHGLHVRAEIDAEGRLDWAGLLRPREDQAQQSPPPVLHVGHATVEAGRLALTDLRGPTPASVSLGKIEIEAFDISTQVGEERPEGRYGLSAVLPEEGSLRAQGS
ncbi:MAG: AsmA family protein, partial [Methylibium sp.]|nr:AsmA family protein [Methylibium sp.]